MTLSVSFVAAALTAMLLCANASAKPQLAPADEYFGRMKMSVLEIRNRLHDLDRRANVAGSGQSESIVHDADLAEDAIRDWQRKYPADPWLPKDIAGLIHIYGRIHTPAGLFHLRASTTWLERRYAHYHAIIARDSLGVLP